MLRVSKKPDQRPAMTQLYDEVISDVVNKITYEKRTAQTDPDCAAIVHDPNVINLFNSLAEKIAKNDVLKNEVERAKVEVATTAETKTRDRRNVMDDPAVEDM